MFNDFLAQPFVRKFAIDFIETSLALLATITFVFPHSVAEAQGLALVIAGSIGAALIAAGRRAFPAFKSYVMDRLFGSAA